MVYLQKAAACILFFHLMSIEAGFSFRFNACRFNCGSSRYDKGTRKDTRVTPDWSVRQANGGDRAGRLEIFFKQTWSTVCDSGFGVKEAQVACKMLTFDSSRAFPVGSFMFGPGGDEANILLDNFVCGGTERSLANCNHSGVFKHNCSHRNDVGVICRLDDHLSLAGTHRIKDDMGRVNINVGGRTSSLCGKASTGSADVICSQLRLESGAALITRASTFGPRQETGFVMIDLNCSGSETSIFACDHRILGIREQCDTEELGVVCSNINVSLYIVTVTSTTYPLLAGTNVTLKCENALADESADNYTWPETAGGRPVGEYLIFDNVRRTNHRKNVRCSVEYGNDLQHGHSDSFLLEIYYPPVITIISDVATCSPQTAPHVCVVTRGHNVTLLCKAKSNPPPASFKWFGKTRSNTKKLNIIAAEPTADDGQYTCLVETGRVTNDQRLPLSSDYQLTLIVQYPPSVLSFKLNAEDNKTVNVSENSNVIMTCVASGRPAPRMRLVGGSNRHELMSRAEGDIESHEKSRELNFFMCKAQCEDSGDYTCEVDNGVDNVTQSVLLLVTCAPKRKSSGGELLFIDRQSDNRNLLIEMTALPTPQVTAVTYQRPNSIERLRIPLAKNPIHTTCFANPLSPASVTCNISVTQADRGFYHLEFSNDHGNLTVGITVITEGTQAVSAAQHVSKCWK
ncbi:uncharacterized protein LOC112567801 [Pomacea canaliculata]|uniref:uncharacterized protein LOC112567801 n=1 Tax=Pomacea canaliculata TaxID=400727 RepID=UPI000D7382BB|nr:uncharacterized protein LOC112567801 [Pomacea canaliculata]